MKLIPTNWLLSALQPCCLLPSATNVCCRAIFQGGLIGVAGKFPPLYMGGMMAGQALGGIFPALVNIVVIALDVQPPGS